MAKKILVISGSPKKDGNTDTLIGWLCEGAAGAEIEVVHAASLTFRGNGCISCRMCQKKEDYGCTLSDDARDVLLKMAQVDVIVMATPLYFFSMSAQLKIIVDRMFSLYKWDNEAGTMRTVLKGKTLALMASAYEDVGLEALENPFRITADYTGMKFESLLIPNAGISGQVKKLADAREKAVALGKKLAG